VRALGSLESARRLLSSNPDLIVAHKLNGFVTLTQLASVTCPIALDLDDMEHKAALRLLRFPPHYPGKLLTLTRPIGLAWLEHVASRRSAVTFICSEQDKRWMERFIRARRVMVLPNAVDVRTEVTVVPDSQNILFVGTLNYLPNAEAARWFIKEIWPHILQNHPKATLTIAGPCPERVPGYDTAHPSICFPGYVPDLDPLYEKAQLVVCPLQAGGGTRIKIIEAAMYGRPVISTPLGAEGLDFQNPNEIRIKKDAASFINECVRLLEDISACRSIGAKAYARAFRQYSRDAFISKAGAVLRKISSSDEHG
jgi:glycosyltransferase involved in cell wall biosynthesis